MERLQSTKRANTPAKYFVYALVDPRNGERFYIGKGSGNRPKGHLREAKAGVSTSKCDRIRDIQKSGNAVQIKFLDRFHSEQAAYAAEAALIQSTPNLTNIVGGSGRRDNDAQELQFFALLLRKPHPAFCTPSFMEAMDKRVKQLGEIRGWDWVKAKFQENHVALEIN